MIIDLYPIITFVEGMDYIKVLEKTNRHPLNEVLQFSIIGETGKNWALKGTIRSLTNDFLSNPEKYYMEIN